MHTELLYCTFFRLIARLACQAEGKWTQVYGNCEGKSRGRRGVHNGEFEMNSKEEEKKNQRSSSQITLWFCAFRVDA